MDRLDRDLEKKTEIAKKQFEKEERRILAKESSILKTPAYSAEKTLNEVVASGKKGKDYDFIDLGKQDVETRKIDTPNLRPEDFKKRSINEMEEYILQGGLEQIDKYHPIKLIKVGDQYCVGSDGHHRVLLAEHMQVKTIPARVKELKILK